MLPDQVSNLGPLTYESLLEIYKMEKFDFLKSIIHSQII